MKKNSNNGSGGSSNLDRKTIERNRRIHMKGLCFKLVSLIPHDHHHKSSKDILSQLDLLDHATLYIQELRKRVDELKKRKQSVMRINNISSSSTTTNDHQQLISQNSSMSSSSSVLPILEVRELDSKFISQNSSMSSSSSVLPILEVRELDSNLEVILISGLNKNFMFYQVINVLEEEGVEVINASFSIVGDKVYHTIHSQVTNSRIGVETSRLCERLKDLIHS